jgi:AbrB family looped-hinge helix DNA binding protein
MAGMNTNAELDKLGRLVVPKRVRDAMRLRPGHRFVVEHTEDTIVLRTEQKGRGLHKENGWWVFDAGVPMSTEMAEGLIDEEREARTRYLSGQSEQG